MSPPRLRQERFENGLLPSNSGIFGHFPFFRQRSQSWHLRIDRGCAKEIAPIGPWMRSLSVSRFRLAFPKLSHPFFLRPDLVQPLTPIAIVLLKARFIALVQRCPGGTRK